MIVVFFHASYGTRWKMKKMNKKRDYKIALTKMFENIKSTETLQNKYFKIKKIY